MRESGRLMDNSMGNNTAVDSYKFDRPHWHRNECLCTDRHRRGTLDVDHRGIPDHTCIQNHLESLGIWH